MPAEKLFKLKRFSKLRIKQLWDDLRIYAAWYASKKEGKIIKDRKTGKAITFREIIKRFAKTRALLVVLGYPMVRRKRKLKIKKTTRELYRLARPLIKKYVKYYSKSGLIRRS